MGAVWRALDLRLEREVAIKILKDVDEVRYRALIAEAKLACQLNHPNIAHIYEAGEVEGVPYIAMELVEGQTLRSFVGRTNELSWLLNVALQGAAAVQHAQEKSIVHRDIKPENLVIKADGTLKILDFGIARIQQGSAMRATGHHATLIERTAPGYSQGTPAYMSPEQANGYELTGASDQFSLGVVLYELAMGVHPFLRGSLVETLFAVVKDPIQPLHDLRKDLSPTFCAAVDQMLVKDPKARFGSMQECQACFKAESMAGSTTTKAPLVPPAPRQRLALVGGALGLLALGGLGSLFFVTRGGSLAGLAAARRAAETDFAKGRRTIAVLPLEQMVPDPALAWLSVSFADAMTTGLLQRENVLVTDRLRVQEVLSQFGETPGQRLKAFGQVAKALKVESLIQGSYQVVGDRLRVSVRILDPVSGRALHQFQVERPKAAMLEVEDELQKRLPTELGLGAMGTGLGSRASNPHTRELYVKGSQVLTEGNIDSMHLARGYFQEALSLEPDYAPARAGLAWTLQELGSLAALSQGRFQESQKHFVEARKEAERAIQLDPAFSQAYRALARILMRQGDLDGASKAALQAVRLDPADTRAYIVLADMFASLEGEENFAAARRYFEKALALDPDVWNAHHRFAVLLQNAGLLDQAVPHAERAIALRASAEIAYVTLVDCQLWRGNLPGAEAALGAGLRNIPGSILLKNLSVLLAAERGDVATTEARARELAGSWPAFHSGSVLLQGLPAVARKDRAEALRVYQAWLQGLQGTDWSAKIPAEKRITSVNLYFMARNLARLGAKAEAQPFVDLADRLHGGKKKVMAVDPVFR